jgi:2-iminobutanoate/2-iminopropanoate deaminase
MKAVLTSDAPTPLGHYTQGLIHGGILYISGQLPIDPETGEKLTGSIEEQTQRVLENIYSILIAAGSDKDKVLKTTVYISDLALWDRVNAVYSHFFKEHRPARAVVPTTALHFGCQIEIDAIAAIT